MLLSAYLVFFSIGEPLKPLEQEIYRTEISLFTNCVDISSNLNKSFRDNGTSIYTKCEVKKED